MTLALTPTSTLPISSENHPSGSTPTRRKSGPKPRSNEEKTIQYLNRLDFLTASAHDVAHALSMTGSWGPVKSVVILEKLVRAGKAKKMKVGRETRYARTSTSS